MDDNDKLISPDERLKLIESMINRARNDFGEKGHLYLIWGWVVVICSVSHFIMWQFHMIAYPQLAWMLTWLALIYQVVYLVRTKKARKVKTYTDDILAYVWLVFSVCMFLMMFVMIRKDSFEKMYPMFLVLYGMPTFLSGKILKVTSLCLGGICCWALAVAATFTALKYQLLLITLSVVIAWIIPGYIMQAKYKKNKFYGSGE